MDCIFCKIVAGSVEAHKVFENDKVLVFLDITPNTNGHLLIIPKDHYLDITTLPNDIWANMGEVLNEMMILLNSTLHPTGYTIIQNNGSAQEVRHFHIHLIPRYNHDLLGHTYNKDLLMPLDEVYHIIKEKESK